MSSDDPKKKATFILPERIIEAMRILAHDHRRSLNAEIIWALEQYIREST
jgi:hypothetical protein